MATTDNAPIEPRVEHSAGFEPLIASNMDIGPVAEGRRCSEMLWAVLTKTVFAALPRQFHFCEVTSDASQWSERILDEYPAARGVILGGPDNAKGENRGRSVSGATEHVSGRLRISPNDFASGASEIEDKSFDLTLSVNGTLARVERPDVALRELVRITKPAGLVVCLVPNLHHAVFLNLARGSLEDAERALAGRARIAPQAQELNLFTRTSIEDGLRRAGACPQATDGLLAVVSPWNAYGTPSEARESATEESELHARKQKILAIEQALFGKAGLALPGSDLLSVAVVPPSTQRWGDFWLPDCGKDVLQQIR